LRRDDSQARFEVLPNFFELIERKKFSDRLPINRRSLQEWVIELRATGTGSINPLVFLSDSDEFPAPALTGLTHILKTNPKCRGDSLSRLYI
jgi:hypothetical protein